MMALDGIPKVLMLGGALILGAIQSIQAQEPIRAEIISTQVICKQPDRYIGWPTIAKTRAGELLVVFSGDRDAHVCPWGKTQMVRSLDNGKTWTEPVTINNTPLDDRDAGIIETREGTLIVSWFTSLAFVRDNMPPGWRRHLEKITPETQDHWLGSWIRRSEDGGKTWGDFIKVRPSAPHGPIELADGRLLYAGTGNLDDGSRALVVEESRDDGRTWRLISSAPILPDEDIQHYHEPHVVETKDGKLVMMIRHQDPGKGADYLHQCESLDGGKSWSVVRPTPIWGVPPHLIRLSDDRLLVSYGRRISPHGERATISLDGGETWEVEQEIELSKALSGDLGYPASTQLDDGSIVTIYYQIDQPGEKTSLMATHWRLD